MKPRYLLLSLMLFASLFAWSKDVITRTDGTKIDVKVEEITETVVKYRKVSNLTGPIYSIPLQSIATIVYENGSVDEFNTAPESTPTPQFNTSQNKPTSTSMSDEELIRRSNGVSAQSPNKSDAELLRYSKFSKYYDKNTTSQKLYNKAKNLRIIAWTGCALFVGAGIVIPLCIWNVDGYEAPFYGVMASGIVAGAAWCTGFNLWARSLSNQAREMEFYSHSIIEDEVMRFGDKSLTAGISVLDNQMTHTQGYGLSLKFTF